MANKKISQLDPIGTIDVVQDSIPIVDYSEGVTKRTNLVNIGQRVLEANSTTNLAEGTNLYFTNTRVYTKVKASLLAGSNTSITFDDTLQTITIASQGNVQSVNTKTGAVVLTTTDISEGTNEYFTAARVRAVVLTGLSLATNAVISATDTVLSAFGKLQAQISANLSTLTSHTSNTSNPHATTKAQVGLGDVPNVDTTNASNISSGTLGDARLSSNVTTQGNTFNAANKLVQLDGTAKLPAVDGSQLTNLPSFTPPNGLLKIASAISTTFQVVKDYVDNASVLFLNSRRVGIGKDTSVTTQSVAVVEVQDTNTSIVLKPNGTGAIIASVPDGTATGGNARGQYAVELQLLTNNNTKIASGNYSGILSGYSNTANGTNSIVLGGNNNNSSGTNSITAGQGSGASGQYGIALGNGNNANGTGSTSSGGASNNASSNYSTISGGQSNTASTNTHATVVGGQSNTSSGLQSISGGFQNTSSGQRSVTLGDRNNASSTNAIALGSLNTVSNQATAIGLNNNASAFGSLATGDSSEAYINRGHSHANGKFSTNGDSQLSNCLMRNSAALITGGTVILYTDGNSALLIPNGNNRAWKVTIDTIAVVTAITGTATGVSVGHCYSETKQLLFKRIGGTSSIVGTVDTSAIKSDLGMATASITISAGGSQQMAITFAAPIFLGGGSITCRIVSKVMLVEVAY
jgi:hypothetical protein